MRCKFDYNGGVIMKENKSTILDRDFFKDIQPVGNIVFGERCVKKGNGYETCIHIYEFPESAYSFWFEDFITSDNAMVTVDISDYDIEEAKSHINSAMNEDNFIMSNAQTAIDAQDASNSYSNLATLYNDISTAGEVLKKVHIRIFVCGETLQELEINTSHIVTRLESIGYRVGVYLNEQDCEYQSRFLSYSEQDNLYNHRAGHPIPAISIAGGYPYNYVSLNDPLGQYLGYVDNGGAITFDLFHNDAILHQINRYRLCYDGFIVGKKGSGKSTLLKKLVLSRAIMGDFVRGIAVSNEFDELVMSLGGKMIPMDGNGGKINLLEVMKTGEDERTNFTAHLSKLNTIYQFLSPESDSSERTEFENLCRELYLQHGINADMGHKVTGLPTTQYPTFTDLLYLVRNELYDDFDSKKVKEHITSSKVERLEKIELVVNDIVTNYGYIFDGYTSFPNISQEQIVFFDIRNLTSLKPEILNAQMFNILSLYWSTMLDVGLPQKTKWDSSKHTTEEFSSILHTMLIIDEAHILIKSGNVQILKFLEKFERETRKYFTGLLMATQSMRDLVPESASAEFLDELKILFELTQYKFIMQQDSSSVALLRSIFGSNLSESDYEGIPRFSQGECILFDGIQSIRMRVDCNAEELSLFNGGA